MKPDLTYNQGLEAFYVPRYQKGSICVNRAAVNPSKAGRDTPTLAINLPIV